MLTAGATDARADLLVNIEREQPTTAPPKPGQQGCNGEAQYVVVKGNYKLIVGGGGESPCGVLCAATGTAAAF